MSETTQSTASAARVLVIDNHDSYTYNLVQMVATLTGVMPDVIPVDQFDVASHPAYAAIVISPGPGNPTSEPAFDVCLKLFRTRTSPILGVCLGHQGLVVAHGGSVGRIAPTHGVVDTLCHDGGGLFQGVEAGAQVVRYHSLAAHRVPDILHVSATSSDGEVMAVAHRVLPHYGVQFHPESVLTIDGERIIANFLRLAKVPLPTPSRVLEAGSPTSHPTVRDLHRYERWIEPAQVADHLLRGQRRAFWLDSAEQRDWTGRHSVLGYLDDTEDSVVVGGPQHGSISATAVPRHAFLRHLSELMSEHVGAEADVPAVGGWVGIAGYETQEVLSSKDEGSPADGFFMRVNRVVVFDHLERSVTYTAETADQRNELREALDAAACAPIADVPSRTLTALTKAPWKQYRKAFARISEALRAGDTYEAVLTFPLQFDAPGDPLDHYFALRRRNPAPFAAFLRHEEHVVLSASPERMLRVEPNAVAEVRPIKGTLPRSKNPERDAILRWRLATDEKVRRENLMITDLVRNDLGQVCEPGSVLVTQLMAVESYQAVHQLVSAVSGTLRPLVSPIDCLRAVFPPGSMTGAPKRRTMELIRAVESGERGLYAGALGWFDGARAEFAVVIRTLHGSDGRLSLHVGGGIIVGSDTEEEFVEAMDKARSVSPSPVRARHSGWTSSEVSRAEIGRG